MTGLDSTVVWIAIALLSVGTYALRASFVLGIDLLGELPSAVEELLPYVPVAVLAALVAPYLLLAENAVTIGLHNERLIAGLVAFAIARKTGSLTLTVGGGMSFLWVLQWL